MALTLARVKPGPAVQNPLIVKDMQIARFHWVFNFHIVGVDDVPKCLDGLVGFLHQVVGQILWREGPIGKANAFYLPVNI